MTPQSHPERFSTLIMLGHWLTLVLIVAAYASMEFEDAFARGSSGRELLKSIHYSAGLSVLLLLFLRLPLRWLSAAPPILPAPAAWQRLAAHGMHMALYAWMLSMPLLGWATQGAEGHAVSFFGIPLPSIISPSEDWADTLEDLHETLGQVGYFLIGLHAAAALFHHYGMRDNTLRRMLPTR